MSGVTATESLPEYLGMLFGAEPPGASIELRHRLRNGAGMGREFHPVEDRHRLPALIAARGASTDLYIGVAPRSRQEGTRDAIARSHALFVDCDTPESIAALESFDPAPSMVVQSGAGRHAYWSLWPPVIPDALERANRRLAHALGADMRATDAARILRPPGTMNFKRGEPVPVTVERRAVEVYELDQVVGGLPPIEPRVAPARTAVRSLDRGGDPLAGLTPPLYVEALTGLVPGRDGKVACPFHEDRTPSLHAYETPEQGWTCFGCLRAGTIIDFGAALYGIEPRGAGYHEIRRRLAGDLLRNAAA